MRRAWTITAAFAFAFAAVVLVALALGDDDDGSPEGLTGFNNNAVGDGLAGAEEAAELIERAGGTIDRVQVRWATLEPSPGEYEWELLDAIYRADRAHGLRPLLILAFAPRWAAVADPSCDPAEPSCHLPPAPTSYGAFARTAAELAERYPDAAGIEIWNEPNAPHFWAPEPDPEAYAKLLAASSEAIREVDPDMPVVGGATSGSPGFTSGHISDDEFLDAILAAGAAEHLDAVSVHAYPDPGDVSGATAVADAERLSDVVADTGLPLWITETGISTTGPDAVTEDGQALAMIELSERLPQVSGVEMVLIHTLIRPERGPADPQTGFGLLAPGVAESPTQAYCALAEAWGGSGC